MQFAIDLTNDYFLVIHCILSVMNCEYTVARTYVLNSSVFE